MLGGIFLGLRWKSHPWDSQGPTLVEGIVMTLASGDQNPLIPDRILGHPVLAQTLLLDQMTKLNGALATGGLKLGQPARRLTG